MRLAACRDISANMFEDPIPSILVSALTKMGLTLGTKFTLVVFPQTCPEFQVRQGQDAFALGTCTTYRVSLGVCSSALERPHCRIEGDRFLFSRRSPAFSRWTRRRRKKRWSSRSLLLSWHSTFTSPDPTEDHRSAISGPRKGCGGPRKGCARRPHL